MRKFTGEELTQDQVLTLLKAALMSPSSKRSNCWQFIVIDDKDMLEKLSLCKESAETDARFFPAAERREESSSPIDLPF